MIHAGSSVVKYFTEQSQGCQYVRVWWGKGSRGDLFYLGLWEALSRDSSSVWRCHSAGFSYSSGLAPAHDQQHESCGAHDQTYELGG